MIQRVIPLFKGVAPYVLDVDHGHDILHLDESGSGAVSMKDGRVVHAVDLQNHILMKQTTL